MKFDYQQSLFDEIVEPKEPVRGTYKILFWNIQNPSLERAKKQFSWLFNENLDLVVLTEMKESKAFYYYKGKFEDAGYTLFFETRDGYFTVVAIRNQLAEQVNLEMKLMQERVQAIEFTLNGGKTMLIGAYVPPNSDDINKIERKDYFQKNLINEIYKYRKNNPLTHIIFGGDFNILEPEHLPKYESFEKWEYFYNYLNKIKLVDKYRTKETDDYGHTWVRGRDAQRIDFIFTSSGLENSIEQCTYIHEIRLNKLSDHSGQLLVLNRN